MGSEPTMTLLSVRKDGKREPTKLAHQSLDDARHLAHWVLHAGNGLYSEVDICSEEGTIETIRNPAVTPGWNDLKVTRNQLANK